jgi:hypothetical protein
VANDGNIFLLANGHINAIEDNELIAIGFAIGLDNLLNRQKSVPMVSVRQIRTAIGCHRSHNSFLVDPVDKGLNGRIRQGKRLGEP